jgi:hypothetical protein
MMRAGTAEGAVEKDEEDEEADSIVGFRRFGSGSDSNSSIG